MWRMYIRWWVLGLAWLSSATAERELTPVKTAEVAEGRSLVYCPTFQKVWDGLKLEVGGPVQMVQAPGFVNDLNKQSCRPNVFPEKAMVSGFGRVEDGILPHLKAELERNFGKSAPDLPAGFSDADSDVVAYAYFRRNLSFPVRFARAKSGGPGFNEKGWLVPVQYFGVRPEEADQYSQHLRILHYKDEDEFTIQLNTKTKGEFVVLSRMPRPKSLEKGIETVLSYLKPEVAPAAFAKVSGRKVQYANTLMRGDTLAVPVIDLDVMRVFPELSGKDITYPAGRYGVTRIDRAFQRVQLQLDESGAKVESEAAIMGGEPFGALPPPRKFIFDEPFLLSIWRREAKQPYLAVWVGSSDILVPTRPVGQ